MNVTIRCYKKQDYDLLTLYQDPNFNLTKAIRMAVHAYANGESVMIAIPPYSGEIEIPKVLQFHVAFTEEDDGEEVIQLLKNVQSGFRNNFIKNLVRSYLIGMRGEYYLKKGVQFQPPSIDTDNLDIYRVKENVFRPKKQQKNPVKKTVSKPLREKPEPAVEDRQKVVVEDVPKPVVEKKPLLEAEIKVSNSPIKEGTQQTKKEALKPEPIKILLDEPEEEAIHPIEVEEDTSSEDSQNNSEDFDFFGSLSQMMNDF